MSASNLINKLGVFQTCMNAEQAIRTSYQSLLTTLEAAIFGLVFTLYQLELTHYLWLLPVAGIFLCMFFGIACEYRARNVDFWVVQIVKLVKGTDLEATFESGKYRWIPLGKVGFGGEYLFGHWFERVLISAMLILWLFALWFFHSPLIILLLGIGATIYWIIYAFRVIELKGKIMI